MKKAISKKEAQKKIDGFFQKRSFSSEEIKKIRRLSMRYNIKLGNYRKLFCKSCLNKLEGKLRVNKEYKTIECGVCGQKNRHKI